MSIPFASNKWAISFIATLIVVFKSTPGNVVIQKKSEKTAATNAKIWMQTKTYLQAKWEKRKQVLVGRCNESRATYEFGFNFRENAKISQLKNLDSGSVSHLLNQISLSMLGYLPFGPSLPTTE